MLPSLFISHGSPDLSIKKHAVSDFLRSLASNFKKPESIIIVSAHWFTKDLEILSNPNPRLIYDFYGFPNELYMKKYPAANDISLVDNIVSKIETNGLKIRKNSSREGYDHGVWSILSMIYPNADIPVVQLSLPLSYDIDMLIRLGEILKEFRDESLVITSGNITHNLRDVDWNNEGYVREYAKVFRDFVVDKLEKGEIEALKDIENIPYLKENHPTLDHFLPLYISIGGSNDHIGESLIENYMYGNLAMDTIIFKE